MYYHVISMETDIDRGVCLLLSCVQLSCVQLFVNLWTVACQALLFMEFSSQEYWSGLPFPSPGDLSDPGIKPWSSALQTDCLLSEPSWMLDRGIVVTLS